MEAEDRIKALVDQLKVAGLENTRARAFVGDIAKAIQYAGSWESHTFAADVLEAVKERHAAYVSEADENARLVAGFAAAQEEIARLKAALNSAFAGESLLRAQADRVAVLEAKMEFAESLLRDALRGGR